MTVILAGVAVFVAAVIQRITGLGFVLVLIGPIVLLYGPVEGVTIAVLLALVASLAAIPMVWKHIDWHRTWWLVWPGLLATPFGVLVVRLLPDAALLLVIAAMAVFALVAGRISALAASLTGRRGAVVAGAASGFMNAASGLGGPPLAAYAVGDKWAHVRFAASVQVVFVALDAATAALRGLPGAPIEDVGALVLATIGGIAIGSILARNVSPRIGRIAMLVIAWAGAAVVLVRGILALF